jgi:predicted TIM-barrel fold metal-dependent hydrolase
MSVEIRHAHREANFHSYRPDAGARMRSNKIIYAIIMKHVLFFLILFSFSCSAGKGWQIKKDEAPAIKPALLNDHHVHLMSPQLISVWKQMGIPFSKQDHFYSNIDTIFEVTGAGRISLVSMAYVYSSDEFGGDSDNISEKIKTENNYLAAAKDKYPDRVIAYYGVDPLSQYAIEEIKRCHEDLKLDAIKLHFNASQVYLTEPAHLIRVKNIFQYASVNQIPVLLHFDNSHPKFGKTDVKILADSVLSKLSYVNLQIAHFGTSGGFNQKTKNVLDSFIELFTNDHPISKHKISFDISAVCLDKDADGVPQLTKKDFEDLSVYCRKLGFNRIVFGTDYPLYKSFEYLDILRTKLNLTKEEEVKLLEDK